MNVEERHWFDAQMLRIQQTAAVIAERQVEFQALPIGQPDSVPKRQWVQKKKHGKADARALTTAEISMRAEHLDGLDHDARLALRQPPRLCLHRQLQGGWRGIIGARGSVNIPGSTTRQFKKAC